MNRIAARPRLELRIVDYRHVSGLAAPPRIATEAFDSPSKLQRYTAAVRSSVERAGARVEEQPDGSLHILDAMVQA